MKYLLFLLAFLIVSAPARATEHRVKIAVIDTGINITNKNYPYLCENEHPDLTHKGISDLVGHGSVVADLIIQGLDPTEYCILVIKWYHTGKGIPEMLGKGIQEANLRGAKIINISAVGSYPDVAEKEAILAALNRGATVVVAAGNEGMDLDFNCNYYPACYPVKSDRFHVVADYLNGLKSIHSNYGGPVTDKADGRLDFAGKFWKGTSMSAGIITNRVAKHHDYLKN